MNKEDIDYYLKWSEIKVKCEIAEAKAKYRTQIAIGVMEKAMSKSKTKKTAKELVTESYAIADELIKQQYKD